MCNGIWRGAVAAGSRLPDISAMPKPTTVAEYIAAAPVASRARLRQVRAAVRAAAPGATEGLKWSMPAFTYKRILVTFAVFKQHIGFYPTPSAIEAFARELKGYKSAAGSVQFPHDEPLPLALIKKITACRVKESTTEDAKWRT